ncbi:hypothetical protein E2562_037952 [Oryza meyeriana var. granulata]|uniref:Uncharacterized protein n=1 Tax=Oryza meyeriana var. granulata TaxID=110450 RepID=A0A6G1ETZ8_9ORYZ|nr:hypothetical protein E2562_037952 [Oryza meyeriana var. granulata]
MTRRPHDSVEGEGRGPVGIPHPAGGSVDDDGPDTEDAEKRIVLFHPPAHRSFHCGGPAPRRGRRRRYLTPGNCLGGDFAD